MPSHLFGGRTHHKEKILCLDGVLVAGLAKNDRLVPVAESIAVSTKDIRKFYELHTP